MTTAQLTADWIESMASRIDDGKTPQNAYVARRQAESGDVYDVRVSIWERPHATVGTLLSLDTAERPARALADRYEVPFVRSILAA